MRSIGTFEAKTHLTAILDQVGAGESFVITRHGKPIARLTPYAEEEPRMTVQEAVRGLRELSKQHTLGGLHPKDLINEGRR